MNNEQHRISDMYLAAALLAYGAKYVGVDRNNKTRQQFIFEGQVPTTVIAKDDVTLETLKNIPMDVFEVHYTAGRMWLPPSYPASVKQIKSAIHSG